jgi:hypothetical protein
MTHPLDLARVQEELVREFRFGNEEQVRSLLSQLGKGTRQIRAALEAMLDAPESLVRQVAAFGLGELGGPASVKRLERQLAIEEARGDSSGGAVVEDITRALGRIGEASARAALLRRLERLSAGKPERSDVTELALALWRRRHPELIPPVQRSLEVLPVPAPHSMHGLLVLLERDPPSLEAWAQDPTAPLNLKTRTLVVLEADVPDTLVLALPAFISTAASLSEQELLQNRDASYYCQRLFSLLLGDRERLIPALPEHARAQLRTVAQRLLALPSMGSALPAAVVLGLVGRPEDIPLLESRRPSDDPGFAEVFDDAITALRKLH